MSNKLSNEINNMAEEIALPRENGELQFTAPWEARAFGLAVALNSQGIYPWQSFSAGLATEIGQAETAGQETPYYQNWLKALEKLVIEQGLVSAAELEQRAEQQAHHDNHDH